MSPPELQGLVADLRPTVPGLGAPRRARTSALFRENRALSSCFNEVIVPWSKDEVQPVDPAGTYTARSRGTQIFEERPFGITGTAVESRSGDANGQNLRVLGGTGREPRSARPFGGLSDDVFALTPFPILGAMPRLNDSAKTPFRPNVRCETQEPPNLEGGMGSPPPDQTTLPRSAPGPERAHR